MDTRQWAVRLADGRICEPVSEAAARRGYHQLASRSHTTLTLLMRESSTSPWIAQPAPGPALVFTPSRMHAVVKGRH